MTFSMFARQTQSALALVMVASLGLASVGNADEAKDRLAGPDVVELAEPTWFPEHAQTEFVRFQGTVVGTDDKLEPVCSYQFDFTGNFEKARPQVAALSAADSKTCVIEFRIAELDRPFDPSILGLTVVDAGLESDFQVNDMRLGFAYPGTLENQFTPNAAPLLANRDRKFTLLGWWADPQPVPNLRVNSVSVALRAVITRDEVVDVKCKFGYDWVDETSWQRITTSPWDDTECRDRGPNRAVAFTNAAYFNDHFCLTNDTWVYYDKMRVTIWSDRGGNDWYNYGIRDTWGTGRCVELNAIRFDGFAIYPNEYFKIEHTP